MELYGRPRVRRRDGWRGGERERRTVVDSGCPRAAEQSFLRSLNDRSEVHCLLFQPASALQGEEVGMGGGGVTAALVVGGDLIVTLL